MAAHITRRCANHTNCARHTYYTNNAGSYHARIQRAPHHTHSCQSAQRHTHACKPVQQVCQHSSMPAIASTPICKKARLRTQVRPYAYADCSLWDGAWLSSMPRTTTLHHLEMAHQKYLTWVAMVEYLMPYKHKHTHTHTGWQATSTQTHTHTHTQPPLTHTHRHRQTRQNGRQQVTHAHTHTLETAITNTRVHALSSRPHTHTHTHVRTRARAQTHKAAGQTHTTAGCLHMQLCCTRVISDLRSQKD